MKGEELTGPVRRTGIPGEETTRVHARQSEGLGYFRTRPDRMLGIWAPFMALPLTHYILFSRPHGGSAFSSS